MHAIHIEIMELRTGMAWRASKRKNAPLHFLLFTLFLLHLSTGKTTGFRVEDDAIIIEAEPVANKDLKISNPSNARSKRQLFPGIGGGIFPPGWPFNPAGSNPINVSPQLPQFPQFPGININHNHLQQLQPTQAPTTTAAPPTHTPANLGPCRTNNGIYGYCASFRQCYPILYSPDDGHIMNNGLAEMYMNNSGPCNRPEIPNFFMFRADAALRQNQICCGGSVAQQHPTFPGFPFPSQLFPGAVFPQVTMRPPWAHHTTPRTTTSTTTTTTTTTTTPRPTQPQWTPNWPPKQTTTRYPSHIWQSTTTYPTQSWQSTTSYPTHSWQSTTRYPSHVWQSTTRATTPRQFITPSTTTSPPVSSSCGESKIIGGTQAVKGEFPWLVAIIRNNRQVCGGSLIDSQYVLTAAHCFNGITSHELQTLFKVYIGDHDLHVLTDGPMTVKSISKLILHREFHQQYFYNDIALLKLDSPVQFGNNGNNGIAPICLSAGGPYDGHSATVAGWGRTSAQSPHQPGIYRKVELKVWNLQQCANTYGSLAPGGITPQMMCAGVQNKDSCLGDSGGPLMRKIGNRWEQIGLVSWGIGCGTYPGVYTKIADYQDWISRHRIR